MENSPKTKEEDDNKPADSIKVENEFIKDLSAQGEKSNLDAKDEPVETDKNLSSPNSDLNVDLKISEITSQEEVILPLVSTYYHLSFLRILFYKIF